jgi:hypothetical protein
MDNLINDIKKLIQQLLLINEDVVYSEKTLESALTTSRTIKCYKNNKNVSYYVSKFKKQDLDNRDFVRIIVEIPCQNNLRSKNIEIIIDVLKRIESYFVYIDDIKIYFGDGLIHMDIYRENKF